MQNPKSRNGSSDVSKRISPVAHRSSSSTCQALKATNDRSPSRIAVLERRRWSRTTELEFEFIKLQEDLKKARNELNSSMSSRRRAEQEAESAKEELSVLSAELEETRGQLLEVSAAEDARLLELRKLSQERDRAWQFELHTLQKQRSVDNAALSSARSEIKRLKLQSEETLEKSESDAKTMLTESKRQLKNAQGTIEALLADGSRLMESFSIVATELKESRSRVNSLEEVVRRFQEDQSMINYCQKIYHPSADCVPEELVSALESTLIKYQEEQIESTVKIHQAFEWIEKLRMDHNARETELESRLNDAKSELILLKANLFDKEVELRDLSDKNKKPRQSISDNSELKSRLMEKETELQVISGENAQLKTVAEELRAAKLMNSEKEAELRRLRVQTEQWRKAAETAAAVLVAGNNGTTSLERMSSFSSDQLESPVSIREVTSSLFSDELDDESPKKKKSNLMLRRLSGMWKK